MDTLSFISEIIKSLAWPITTISIIVILKDQILALLPRLKKIKWKDIEFDMAKLATETQASLPSFKPSISTEENIKEQLLQLSNLSPRAAIAEAWRKFEKIAIQGIKKTKQIENLEELSNPKKLQQYLVETKLIPSKAKTLCISLKQVRNMAVHDSNTLITQSFAQDYIKIVAEWIKYLKLQGI